MPAARLCDGENGLLYQFYEMTHAVVAPLRAALTALVERATTELAAEGFPPERISLGASADIRHRLQVHTVEVPVDPECDDATLAGALAEDFTARYEALFGAGTAYGEAGIELVTVRVRAAGEAARQRLAARPLAAPEPAPGARAASREVFWPALGRLVETPVYRAAKLAPGNVVEGPAIIEPTTTTVVVHPGQRARLDTYGNLVIDPDPEAIR